MASWVVLISYYQSPRRYSSVLSEWDKKRVRNPPMVMLYAQHNRHYVRFEVSSLCMLRSLITSNNYAVIHGLIDAIATSPVHVCN